MASWYNNDGLLIKYGATEAVAGQAGEFEVEGSNRVQEVVFNLVDLNTSTQVILDDNVNVPKNARIEQIVIEVETAATSGGSATLDFGLVRNDRTTELDYDGFIAAQALAGINAAGKKITYTVGTTSVGALIGTTLANPGLLVAKAGTAVFTAGRVRIRIYWYPL
jgi:hypothetical protein